MSCSETVCLATDGIASEPYLNHGLPLASPVFCHPIPGAEKQNKQILLVQNIVLHLFQKKTRRNKFKIKKFLFFRPVCPTEMSKSVKLIHTHMHTHTHTHTHMRACAHTHMKFKFTNFAVFLPVLVGNIKLHNFRKRNQKN